MSNIPYLQDLLNQFNDSFLHFNDNHFNEVITKQNYDAFILEDIAHKLEAFDDLFAASNFRKNNYSIKNKRERTIITTLGVIRYFRRSYISKHGGEGYYYFIDELLRLEPYQRLSIDLKNEILVRVVQDSYQRIADDFSISKSSISNLMKSLRDQTLHIPDNSEFKCIDTLFIQADECYVSLQKSLKGNVRNKMMVEEVTIHEGLIPVYKSRNKLLNKTLMTRAPFESLDEFRDRILTFINDNYEYKQLYLYGDGAPWIKSTAEYLNATYITDLFHTYQAVNRITTDEGLRAILKTGIIENDIRVLEAVRHSLMNDSVWTKNKEKNYKYLKNNWNHIQYNYQLNNSVGCSQEGINFHYFAKRLTTIPRGFHPHTARLIAQLSTIVHKVSDPLAYLKEFIIDSNNNKNKKQKEKFKDGYLPPQGSLPTHTSNTQTNKMFKNIAHPKLY